MTLISVMVNRGYPIIVSDRALSQNMHLQSVTLPSRNNTVESDQYGERPMTCGFVQKTTIIKDILCVSFAGIVADLKQAHSDIHDFFLYREVNEETLTELHSECNFEQYKESSFVFLFANPSLNRNPIKIKFLGNWQKNDHRMIGTWYTSGTGSEAWNEQVNYFADYVVPTEPFAISAILEAVVYPCIVKSIADEKRSLYNLLEGWGGGMDIIYYYEGKFQRIDNTTYVFWQVDIDESRDVTLHSIIHEHYDDRKLILQNFAVNARHTYQINELSYLAAENKLYDVFFESKKVVSIIAVSKGEEYLSDLFVSDDRLDDDVILSTGLHDGHFSITFATSYIDKLNHSLSEAVGDI